MKLMKVSHVGLKVRILSRPDKRKLGNQQIQFLVQLKSRGENVMAEARCEINKEFETVSVFLKFFR